MPKCNRSKGYGRMDSKLESFSVMMNFNCYSHGRIVRYLQSVFFFFFWFAWIGYVEFVDSMKLYIALMTIYLYDQSTVDLRIL